MGMGPNKDTSSSEVVEVHALVVLQIIKHCRDALPELGYGQLMGLPVDNRLEVTNSFAFPMKKTAPVQPQRKSRWGDEEPVVEEDDGMDAYQVQMMHCLREVNVDNNTVGWYQATYLGNFMNQNTIEIQYSYQQSISQSVVIIYDPLKTEQGTLSLRAFRLSDKFCKLYKENDFSAVALMKNDFNQVFDELPLVLYNTWYDKALLYQLCGPEYRRETIGRLDLSTVPFLEKNMEMLLECVDDLNKEQSQYAYHQRNASRQQQQLLQKMRMENAQREANGEPVLTEKDMARNPQYAALFKTSQLPSRLDNLLITNQIESYCQSINKFAGKSFSKLYVANTLQ